jgi:hypothetical protein
MDSLKKNQVILGKVVSIQDQDPWFCGLARLAMADGLTRNDARKGYYEHAEQTYDLTREQMYSFAYGWDTVTHPDDLDIWQFANKTHGDLNYQDLGKTAARACGFGA